MMNFYALYSRSSETYNTPFLAHDDEEAKRIIEKTVTVQNDTALLYSLDDLQLERVGLFVPDCVQCPVQEPAEIEIISENLVDELCYPPMIFDMLMKLYHKKEVDRGDQ